MSEDERDAEQREDAWTDVAQSAQRKYSALSDRELIDAMRTRDTAAIVEFMRRFQRLAIVHAERLGVRSEDRRSWASEALYEIALVLCRRDTPVPRAPTAYLATAFRRREMAAYRQRMVREGLERGAAAETAGVDERALLGTCSQASIRATYGPAWEPAVLPPVLERLVSTLDEGVSAEERELLSWVGRRVPYSTIAEWLGINRSAAVKRVTRLRARLIEAAMRFGDSLDGSDRAEFVRFLRRTGAFDEVDLSALTEMQGTRMRRGSVHRESRAARLERTHEEAE